MSESLVFVVVLVSATLHGADAQSSGEYPMNNIIPSIEDVSTMQSAICDIASRQRISSCSQELVTLGVFGPDTSAAQQLSLKEIRSRAFNRFNHCLGGNYIKQACYSSEPMKSRYAVADAALDFVCGEAYGAMLLHWDCYLALAARDDFIRCEDQFMQPQPRDLLLNDYTLGSSACYSLRTYMQCIQPLIENSCGEQAFEIVLEAIEKPVNVYLPFCTLSAASTSLSLLLLTSLVALFL